MLFLPYILAVPIVGIVASYMFQLHGAVNDLLATVGLEPLAIDWIGSEHYALMTVAARDRRGARSGFGIVLFLARLMSLDDEPARGRPHRRRGLVPAPAARDPARDARHDRVLRRDRRDHDAGLGLRVRLHAHAGRPGHGHDTLELYIYNVGEVQSLPGRPSAVATMLLVVMCLFIALLFWVRRWAARAERGGAVSAAAYATQRRRKRLANLPHHVVLVRRGAAGARCRCCSC